MLRNTVIAASLCAAGCAYASNPIVKDIFTADPAALVDNGRVYVYLHLLPQRQAAHGRRIPALGRGRGAALRPGRRHPARAADGGRSYRESGAGLQVSRLI